MPRERQCQAGRWLSLEKYARTAFREGRTLRTAELMDLIPRGMVLVSFVCVSLAFCAALTPADTQGPFRVHQTDDLFRFLNMDPRFHTPSKMSFLPLLNELPVLNILWHANHSLDIHWGSTCQTVGLWKLRHGPSPVSGAEGQITRPS